MSVETVFTKPPEGSFVKDSPYEEDPELIKQLEFLKMFEEEVKHPILDEIYEKRHTLEGLKELRAKDPNLMVLYNEILDAQELIPEDPYKKAFINILKLRLILYATNGWFRTKIGFDLWFIACASDPNAYFQLGWEDHFEPARHYRPGEKWRNCPLFRAVKTDPAFSIPDVKIEGYKEIE